MLKGDWVGLQCTRSAHTTHLPLQAAAIRDTQATPAPGVSHVPSGLASIRPASSASRKTGLGSCSSPSPWNQVYSRARRLVSIVRSKKEARVQLG